MIKQETIAACARLLPLCNADGIIDLYATNVDQANHVSHAVSYDFVWSWVPIKFSRCKPFNAHAQRGTVMHTEIAIKIVHTAKVISMRAAWPCPGSENCSYCWWWQSPAKSFVFSRRFPTRHLWRFKQNKSLEAWPHVNHYLWTIGHLLSGSLATHKYRYQVAVAPSHWTHPRIAPSCPSLNQHFGYNNTLLPPRSSLITINHHLSSTNTNPSPVTSINHNSPAAAH